MRSLSRWIPVIGGAIAGGVIALVIASGDNSGKTVTTTTVVHEQQAALPASFSSKGGGMTINQIYRADSPGVVDIVVTQQGSSGGFGLFGGGGSQKTEGEGAGIVYDNKGDILTDEHVVAGATSVRVNFQNGKSYPARVLGTDPSSDVGVIRVNAPASELHPLALANSSNAQVGDSVVAIGSPFSLPETVTQGIVSQTGRSITAPNNYQIPGAIQTDAAINPGNSGGPLLNSEGQVLGLNDQIETNNTTAQGQGSSSGIGFATPINTDIKVANKIISGRRVQHAYVGVFLASNSSGGAEVSSVGAGTPAQAAGLKARDVVTAINGQSVTSTDQFIADIDNFSPGQTVKLTVRRAGQTKTFSVKLGVRPAQSPSGG
jgi:putative serine protease PepD